MISVADAQAHILARVERVAPPEVIPVVAALGRVLAEDVRATLDVPPTANSAVDGYAVRGADIPSAGTRELTVVAELAAGSVFDGTLGAGQALRIMTGAPMPAGADTVYPQEVVERTGDRVRIPAGLAGVNVRQRGEDVRAGHVVLPAGGVLRPQELGVAASLGLPLLLVRQRPRVAILSTGDEVAEPGHARKPGQIFDSNRFSLQGLVEAAGGEATDHGIVPDLYDVLHARLRAAAATADVVLTSGGVSVGDHDLVKASCRTRAASTSGRWRCSRGARSRWAGSARPSSSACPATRWPRCSPSTSSCGPPSGSWRAAASSSRRASTRWRWSR